MTRTGLECYSCSCYSTRSHIEARFVVCLLSGSHREQNKLPFYLKQKSNWLSDYHTKSTTNLNFIVWGSQLTTLVMVASSGYGEKGCYSDSTHFLLTDYKTRCAIANSYASAFAILLYKIMSCGWEGGVTAFLFQIVVKFLKSQV